MKTDNCPNCNISFIGEKIPENIAEYYARTHWRKEIGIDGGYIGIYDGIVAYMCPECKWEFPVSNSKWAIEMFEKYQKISNESQNKVYER